MLCRGSPPTVLWDAQIAFSLERLHHLIVNQVWSDRKSEDIWNEAYPNTPYQLWDADPTITPDATLSFQEMEMVCPWCGRVAGIDLAKFTLMHCRKNVMCACTSCDRRFDIDSLSAQILRQDLLRFLRVQSGWYDIYSYFLTKQARQGNCSGWRRQSTRNGNGDRSRNHPRTRSDYVPLETSREKPHHRHHSCQLHQIPRRCILEGLLPRLSRDSLGTQSSTKIQGYQQT